MDISPWQIWNPLNGDIGLYRITVYVQIEAQCASASVY